MLGNPPWIKVEWNEQALLSDFDPRFAIRKLSAQETADQREAVFASMPAAKADYVRECTATEGSGELSECDAELPAAEGAAEQSVQVLSAGGVACRRWRTGAAASGRDRTTTRREATLRAAAYPRLRAHYQFENELAAVRRGS